MTTLKNTSRMRRLSITIDVSLAVALVLLTSALIATLFVVRRGLWPPRASEPQSLRSGVQ
ncbi:MAG TPA: hypothetical protein VFO62_07500 [Candidatus Binatia bacterium]|nr:hypothetical protein [Candidatus Binatia bacterium]